MFANASAIGDSTVLRIFTQYGKQNARGHENPYYGGYPGAAPVIGEPARWARYVADSLIETSISRDVRLLTRVDKPAVLRRPYHRHRSYASAHA